MTNNEEQLEHLQEQIKQLSEQIEQLKAEEEREAKQPRDNLMGRWAHHEGYGYVLITSQHADDDGTVSVACLDLRAADGAGRTLLDLHELTFQEETTRPEDVTAGEAWLVNTCDGVYVKKNAVALKANSNLWVTGSAADGSAETRWGNDEVELIIPLIPARPQDAPQTVTTEEEYGALPEGSVVAEPGENPWVHLPYMWVQSGATTNDMGLAGTTRQVLRWGWGE